MTRGRVALAVLAAAGAAVAALAPAAGAQMTQGQAFFEERLLADPNTSRHVSELLRGAGFVDRSVAFRDLTGDKKPEALVRVQSGGAAGTVAIYVFSTDTGRRGRGLQAVFRSQKLYRAFTTVDDQGVLSYATARYAPGNALCCPAKLLETSLRWDDRRHTFVIGQRTEAAGPVPGT